MSQSRRAGGTLVELFDRVERVGPEACSSDQADRLRLKLALLIAGDVAADRDPPLTSDQRYLLEVRIASELFEAAARTPVPEP